MTPHDSWPQSLADTLYGKLQEPTAVAVIAAVIAIIITTRLLSGDSPPSTNGRRVPSTPPYWLPLFGHAPQLAIGFNSVLAGFRRQYPEGVFSLVVRGTTHSYIYRPSFISTLLGNREFVASNELISRFGLSAKDRPAYNKVFHDGDSHFERLLAGSGLQALTAATVTQIKSHIADWVTFNGYADQMDWERLAGAEPVETEQGENAMELDLFELTRDFIARTSNAALFGTDFVENFPEIWQSLWRLDKEFDVLASDMPAWTPLPQFQRARATRRKLLAPLREFEDAMDKFHSGEEPGVKWQDLDNVSDIIKDRIAQFREHNMSTDGRASCDLELMWATNTTSGALVAWMLFELSRDPILLEQVREEIAPFIRFAQAQNDFSTGVWIAPEIETLNMDGLLAECPLLKAAYIETLRMYTGASTSKFLSEGLALQEAKKTDEAFLFKKGTYVHIPRELHQMDPAYFPEPKDWQVDRHIKETVDEKGRKTRVAELGSIRPFGGGAATCKGEEFTFQQVVLYTAVVLSLYEILPAGRSGWEVPKTTMPVATKHPKTPMRVWIKRREVAKKK